VQDRVARGAKRIDRAPMADGWPELTGAELVLQGVRSDAVSERSSPDSE
jgi:hypothetical protein